MEIHYICSMDYKRIYDNLIQSRLLLKEERIKLKKQGEYFEGHHIIPKSMGGEGNKGVHRHPNIVILTAREHYIAHALLWLIHRNPPMARAFWTMFSVNSKKVVTSARMFEAVKKDIHSMWTPEKRKEASDAEKARANWTPEKREQWRKQRMENYRKPKKIKKENGDKYKRVWTEEEKRMQSIRMTGKPKNHSPEHIERSRLRMIELNKKRKGNFKWSDEHKQKLRQTWTPEKRKEMSERFKGLTRTPYVKKNPITPKERKLSEKWHIDSRVREYRKFDKDKRELFKQKAIYTLKALKLLEREEMSSETIKKK
jgi:hypothetical protein